jgi:hypothetical protein
MNYIDITQPNQTLKLNLNYNVVDEVEVEVFKDGSDTSVDVFYIYNVLDFKYYQQIELSTTTIERLEDETQYNIVAKETNEFKVIYRGKFQTTSKDLNNLSVNEGQYIKKTTATNYTILD